MGAVRLGCRLGGIFQAEGPQAEKTSIIRRVPREHRPLPRGRVQSVKSVNSSNASLLLEVFPKGVADRSLPLPIHALPPYPLQPISPHSRLTHILLHPDFPSSKWPSPPICTLITTQIHLLNIPRFSSFQYGQTISGCSFAPISPHCTLSHFHALSCHFSRAHSHCSAHLVCSPHTLLSDDISAAHALDFFSSPRALVDIICPLMLFMVQARVL